jgi:hypothetical protein
MEVNYHFKPECVLKEEYDRQMIISYAGKLLETVGSRTLIIGVDNNDVPFVYEVSGRLTNALESEYLDE